MHVITERDMWESVTTRVFLSLRRSAGPGPTEDRCFTAAPLLHPGVVCVSVLCVRARVRVGGATRAGEDMGARNIRGQSPERDSEWYGPQP